MFPPRESLCATDWRYERSEAELRHFYWCWTLTAPTLAAESTYGHRWSRTRMTFSKTVKKDSLFHPDFPLQHHIVVSPASLHKLLFSTLPVQWSFHFHLMLPLHLSHILGALSRSFSRRRHYDITFKCCSFYFPSPCVHIHQGGVKLALQMRYITSDLDSGSCLVYWSTFSPFLLRENISRLRLGGCILLWNGEGRVM